jgi:alpha-glucosidase
MIKKIILGILISIYLNCSGTQNIGVRVLENVSAKGELGSEVQYKIDNKTLHIFNGKLSFVEFPLDRSFLTIAKGSPSVKYNLAAFKFKDEYTMRCANQSIDKIEKIQDGIKISGILHGQDCFIKYFIDLTAENKQSLNFSVHIADKTFNRINLVYRSVKEEQFFGFGEQYTHFNMKGKKPFIFTEEQGIGRGDQPITFGANLTQGAGGNEYTSYAPMPHYITTNNRSVYFENSAYSKFNFEHDEYVKVLFWDNNLKGTIWVSDKPLELIEMYTAKTGRYQGLPDWAYGTWLGLQGGTEKVKKVIKEAKLAGNPVTALWIQDWVGRRVTGFGDQLKWRWYAQENSEFKDSDGNPEPAYPDFKNFTEEMNKDGVKVLGYINSFLAETNAPTSPKQPIKEPNSCGYKRFIPMNDCKPEREPDSFTNPMLEEAKAKGYLVKKQSGEDYMIETVGFPAYFWLVEISYTLEIQLRIILCQPHLFCLLLEFLLLPCMHLQ